MFVVDTRTSTLDFFKDAIAQAMPTVLCDVTGPEEIAHKAEIITTHVWISNRALSEDEKIIAIASWLEKSLPRKNELKVARTAGEFSLLLSGYFAEGLEYSIGRKMAARYRVIGRDCLYYAVDEETDPTLRRTLALTAMRFNDWCRTFRRLHRHLREHLYVPPELILPPPSGMVN